MGGRDGGHGQPVAARPVVADAGPLISLERVDLLDLLPALFGRVVVPPAVRDEVGGALATRPWVAVRAPQLVSPPGLVPDSLGAGGKEAIQLASEIDTEWLLVDDLPARQAAADLGLSIVGTLGVLQTAKRQGLLPRLRRAVDALILRGFYVSARLYSQTLPAADEDE